MLELSLRHAHAIAMAVRANKKGRNQSRHCRRNKNDSAEKKTQPTTATKPAKPAKLTIKVKLKLLPENTGYLSRHEKEMKREKVISETENSRNSFKDLEERKPVSLLKWSRVMLKNGVVGFWGHIKALFWL